MKSGFYEVKVFDGQGNLKEVISTKKLHSIYWSNEQKDRLAKHRRSPNPNGTVSKHKIKF